MTHTYRPGDVVNGHALNVDNVWVPVPVSTARAKRWLGLDLGKWIALGAVVAAVVFIGAAVVLARVESGNVAECQRLHDEMWAKINTPASVEAADEYQDKRCGVYFNDGKIH